MPHLKLAKLNNAGPGVIVFTGMRAPISARVVRLVASSRAILTFFFLTSVAGSSAFGQTLLWSRPATSQPAPGLTVSGPMGKLPATSKPATFSRGLTILLDPAWCSAADLGQLGTDLSRWFQTPGAGPVQLFLLADGKSVTLTVNAAEEVNPALQALAAVPSKPHTIPMALVLGFLRDTTEHAEWRQYVYAGSEPAVAPEARDYTYSLLSRILSDSRIRLSHLRSGESQPGDWRVALEAVSGNSGQRFTEIVDRANRDWFETPIPTWAPADGYRIERMGEAFGADASQPHEIPYVWGDFSTLPDPSAYADLLKLRSDTALSINAPATLPGDAIAQLNRLVSLNPDDVDTLKLAVDYTERVRNYTQAANYAQAMVGRDASNGSYWARLGVDQAQSGASDNAERSLLKARELGVDHPQSARILGELHFARKDYAGAETHLKEAVRREPDRVEVRLALADVHKQLNQTDLLTQDLEQALQSSPDLLDRRVQLIAVYLDRGDKTDARRHLQAGIGKPPSDAKIAGQFAALCERLDEPDQSLKLWSQAIQLDPTMESAHYGLANLQYQGKNWDKALAAADAGILAAPQSGRLQGTRAEVLVALGRVDEARLSLRGAAEKTPIPEVLTTAAMLEDRYGVQSPAYYRTLVQEARDRSAPDSEWKPLAQQGLRASLRVRQTETCEWFAEALASD
ncbi:MAG: tetratricopeptide repeat protein, partial [Acidobacteriota bacterium]